MIVKMKMVKLIYPKKTSFKKKQKQHTREFLTLKYTLVWDKQTTVMYRGELANHFAPSRLLPYCTHPGALWV